MATYVIGDVQGCFLELARLIDRINCDPTQDQLLFVGDLVNRGPSSLEVLRFVRALGPRAIVVLGNHDLHLISLTYGFGRPCADDTLDAVLCAPDRDALVDWLRSCSMMYATGRYVIVHAGLLPQWNIAQALRLAGEVEAALRGDHHRAFLASMYGGQPDTWSDALVGYDRLRVIVNALTRLRFCTPAGRMEFHHKGPPDDTPPGFKPWFALREAHRDSQTIICGHWSALGLYLSDGFIGLDSGCVWGGALTAIRLEDRRIFQERPMRR